MPTDTPALARFGHHPDPAIDFCVEVEEIDAIHYDVRTGIAKDKEDERNRRISRAMSFRVGGDEKAVAAKDRLRVIEREAAQPNPVAERSIGGPTREEAADQLADLLERQKAEIERLSRERDTGVPFTTKEWEWIASGLGNFVEYVMPDGEETEVRALLKKVEALSAAPQPPTVSTQGDMLIPMGRENDGDKHVTAYMCLIDFECELGLASGGNRVYPSIEDIREHSKCVGGCGIVEVEVRATRVVQEPSDEGELVMTAAEIEAAEHSPPSPQPDLSTLTRERDQAREALAKELDAAKADLNSSFFCVFLDGRNEHGSHVVEMPGSNITPDDAKDLVAVLNDQDLGFAEQIIKDAESLGHEVGHCVVTIWDLTHDPEWGVECEYRRISPVLTNLMVGTPDEQRARSVLHPDTEVSS